MQSNNLTNEETLVIAGDVDLSWKAFIDSPSETTAEAYFNNVIKYFECSEKNAWEHLQLLADPKNLKFLSQKSQAVIHCYMGRYYDDPLGSGHRNYDKAFDAFKKSALLGYYDGWAYLGLVYDHGKGIFPDKAYALACYVKAIELMGDENNQRKGILLSRCAWLRFVGNGITGNFTKEDYGKDKIGRYLEAPGGNPSQLLNIGKGFEYLQQAINLNNADAFYLLAQMLEHGCYVLRNIQLANDYYLNAFRHDVHTGNQVIAGKYDHLGAIKQRSSRTEEILQLLVPMQQQLRRQLLKHQPQQEGAVKKLRGLEVVGDIKYESKDKNVVVDKVAMTFQVTNLSKTQNDDVPADFKKLMDEHFIELKRLFWASDLASWINFFREKSDSNKDKDPTKIWKLEKYTQDQAKMQHFFEVSFEDIDLRQSGKLLDFSKTILSQNSFQMGCDIMSTPDEAKSYWIHRKQGKIIYHIEGVYVEDGHTGQFRTYRDFPLYDKTDEIPAGIATLRLDGVDINKVLLKHSSGFRVQVCGADPKLPMFIKPVKEDDRDTIDISSLQAKIEEGLQREELAASSEPSPAPTPTPALQQPRPEDFNYRKIKIKEVKVEAATSMAGLKNVTVWFDPMTSGGYCPEELAKFLQAHFEDPLGTIQAQLTRLNREVGGTGAKVELLTRRVPKHHENDSETASYTLGFRVRDCDPIKVNLYFQFTEALMKAHNFAFHGSLRDSLSDEINGHKAAAKQKDAAEAKATQLQAARGELPTQVLEVQRVISGNTDYKLADWNSNDLLVIFRKTKDPRQLHNVLADIVAKAKDKIYSEMNVLDYHRYYSDTHSQKIVERIALIGDENGLGFGIRFTNVGTNPLADNLMKLTRKGNFPRLFIDNGFIGFFIPDKAELDTNLTFDIEESFAQRVPAYPLTPLASAAPQRTEPEVKDRAIAAPQKVEPKAKELASDERVADVKDPVSAAPQRIDPKAKDPAIDQRVADVKDHLSAAPQKVALEAKASLEKDLERQFEYNYRQFLEDKTDNEDQGPVTNKGILEIILGYTGYASALSEQAVPSGVMSLMVYMHEKGGEQIVHLAQAVAKYLPKYYPELKSLCELWKEQLTSPKKCKQFFITLMMPDDPILKTKPPGNIHKNLKEFQPLITPGINHAEFAQRVIKLLRPFRFILPEINPQLRDTINNDLALNPAQKLLLALFCELTPDEVFETLLGQQFNRCGNYRANIVLLLLKEPSFQYILANKRNTQLVYELLFKIIKDSNPLTAILDPVVTKILEIAPHVARVKTENRYDYFKMVSASPIGKIITEPGYILAPEGLYYIMDTEEPLAQKHLLPNWYINELWRQLRTLKGRGDTDRPCDSAVTTITAAEEGVITSYTNHRLLKRSEITTLISPILTGNFNAPFIALFRPFLKYKTALPGVVGYPSLLEWCYVTCERGVAAQNLVKKEIFRQLLLHPDCSFEAAKRIWKMEPGADPLRVYFNKAAAAYVHMEDARLSKLGLANPFESFVKAYNFDMVFVLQYLTNAVQSIVHGHMKEAEFPGLVLYTRHLIERSTDKAFYLAHFSDLDAQRGLKALVSAWNTCGCELFLMSTNSDTPKKSDRGHLYLYKNEENEIFYQTNEGRFNLETESEIPELLRGGKFDQPEINPRACGDLKLCTQVLNITSNREHTYAYKPQPKGFFRTSERLQQFQKKLGEMLEKKKSSSIKNHFEMDLGSQNKVIKEYKDAHEGFNANTATKAVETIAESHGITDLVSVMAEGDEKSVQDTLRLEIKRAVSEGNQFVHLPFQANRNSHAVTIVVDNDSGTIYCVDPLRGAGEIEAKRMVEGAKLLWLGNQPFKIVTPPKGMPLQRGDIEDRYLCGVFEAAIALGIILTIKMGEAISKSDNPIIRSLYTDVAKGVLPKREYLNNYFGALVLAYQEDVHDNHDDAVARQAFGEIDPLRSRKKQIVPDRKFGVPTAQVQAPAPVEDVANLRVQPVQQAVSAAPAQVVQAANPAQVHAPVVQVANPAVHVATAPVLSVIPSAQVPPGVSRISEVPAQVPHAVLQQAFQGDQKDAPPSYHEAPPPSYDVAISSDVSGRDLSHSVAVGQPPRDLKDSVPAVQVSARPAPSLDRKDNPAPSSQVGLYGQSNKVADSKITSPEKFYQKSSEMLLELLSKLSHPALEHAMELFGKISPRGHALRKQDIADIKSILTEYGVITDEFKAVLEQLVPKTSLSL